MNNQESKNIRILETPYLNNEIIELEGLNDVKLSLIKNADSPFLSNELFIENEFDDEYDELMLDDEYLGVQELENEFEDSIIDGEYIEEPEINDEYFIEQEFENEFEEPEIDDEYIEAYEIDNDIDENYSEFEENYLDFLVDESEYEADRDNLDLEYFDKFEDLGYENLKDEVEKIYDNETFEIIEDDFHKKEMLFYEDEKYSLNMENEDVEEEPEYEDIFLDDNIINETNLTKEIGIWEEENLDTFTFNNELEEPFDEIESKNILNEHKKYSNTFNGVIPVVNKFVPLEENQVATKYKCKYYPTQFKLSNWPNRWKKLRSSKRKQFFNHLRRRKKFKLAVLARGKISVETKTVKELTQFIINNTTTSFDELIEIIPKVNVTVELVRILKIFKNKKDLDEALIRHIRYYQNRYSSKCFFGNSLYSLAREGRYEKEWVENKLQINLNRAYQVTGINKLNKQELSKTLLVTSSSLPRELIDHLRFKITIDKGVGPKRISSTIIRKDLNAILYKKAYTNLKLEFVKRLINNSRKTRGSWIRRIPEYNQFLLSFDSVGVGIDLFSLKIPKDLDVIKYKAKEFNIYLKHQNLHPFISFLSPIKDKSYIEKIYHIDLSELVNNLSTNQIKDNNFYFLVYIIFPKTIYNSGYLISNKNDFLDHFKTNKSFLSKNHKRRIYYLARYIAESWAHFGISWKNYKPVSKIQILGAGDARGSEKYNIKLGLKRAKNVERVLKIYINHIWKKMPGKISSLTPKIFFNVNSIGNLKAKAEGGKKDNPLWRAVNIKLEHLENGEKQLIKIIEELSYFLLHHKNIVKKIMNVDEVKVVKCILEKLKNQLVDDRIAIYPKYSYQFRESKLDIYDFVSARNILVSSYDFNKTLTSRLKEIYNIHRMIKANNDKMNRRAIAGGEATDFKIKSLLRWTKMQKKNDKSIYSCYD